MRKAHAETDEMLTAEIDVDSGEGTDEEAWLGIQKYLEEKKAERNRNHVGLEVSPNKDNENDENEPSSKRQNILTTVSPHGKPTLKNT